MELFFGLILLAVLGLFALGVVSSVILWVVIAVLTLMLSIIGFFIKVLPWLIMILLGWWVIVRIRERDGPMF